MRPRGLAAAVLVHAVFSGSPGASAQEMEQVPACSVPPNPALRKAGDPPFVLCDRTPLAPPRPAALEDPPAVHPFVFASIPFLAGGALSAGLIAGSSVSLRMPCPPDSGGLHLDCGWHGDSVGQLDRMTIGLMLGVALPRLLVGAGLLGEGIRRQRRDSARAYPAALHPGPSPGGLALGVRF